MTSLSESPTGSAEDAQRLRRAMVDEINSRWPLSERVAAVMRTVPRHVFIPQVTLEVTYSDSTVVTRRDSSGIVTSSSTGPGLMGVMLDQLGVDRGMRVLEIGAGTGYNAALLAGLVGPSGHVTSVEITPEVADEARGALAVAGVANVEVVCGDGQDGYLPNAPYERIIATAGVWEIPQAWAEQLAPGGVLVAPLRIKGLTRSVALSCDLASQVISEVDVTKRWSALLASHLAAHPGAQADIAALASTHVVAKVTKIGSQHNHGAGTFIGGDNYGSISTVDPMES